MKKSVRFYFVFAVFLCLGSLLTPAAFAQQSDYVVIDIVTNDPLVQGNGYDLGSRSPKQATCIQGGTQSSYNGASSNSGHVDVVTASTDLSTVLDLSYGAMMESSLSSNKVAFTLAQNTTYRSDTITAVFHKTSIEAQSSVLSGVALTSSATSSKGTPQFRSTCGDYYIAGIIHGTSFHGLVKMDASSFDYSLRTNLAFNDTLSTVLLNGSSSVSLGAQVTAAMKSAQTSVSETTLGGNASSITANDLASMVTDYKNFGSGAGYPMKVVLAKYPSLSAIATDPTNNENNAKLWFQFYTIKATADDAANDVLQTYRTYMPNKPGQLVTWAQSDMQSLSSQANNQMTAINSKIQSCKTATCTDLTASYQQSLTSLTSQLPRYAGHPNACAGINAIDSKAPDGDYDLYFNGSSPYHATCVNLKTSPTTYLKLVYTNFSEVAPKASGSGDTNASWGGTKVRTAFTKVRIDPVTLTVTTTDLKYATTTGGPLTPASAPTFAEFAAPKQCENYSCSQASATVDLRNTGFVVDTDKSDIHTATYPAGGGGYTKLFSEANSVLNITSPCGHCGGWSATLVLKPAQ